MVVVPGDRAFVSAKCPSISRSCTFLTRPTEHVSPNWTFDNRHTLDPRAAGAHAGTISLIQAALLSMTFSAPAALFLLCLQPVAVLPGYIVSLWEESIRATAARLGISRYALSRSCCTMFENVVSVCWFLGRLENKEEGLVPRSVLEDGMMLCWPD